MVAAVVNGPRELAFIPVNSIRESAQALRVIDRKNPEYVALAEAVANNGVLSAISVRKMEDAETGETFYSLVDGLQRWTASKDAGFETIPAQVISSTDFEVLLQQTIGNTARVETLPAEHAKHLQRILQACPTMTNAELATKLSRSPTWIAERLKLTKLIPEAGKLVDANRINLLNAYCLAMLPQDEQEAYLEQAQSLQNAEFSNIVAARNSAIAKAKRANAVDSPSVFTHKPYLRKPADILAESESGVVGAETIAEQRITTPEEAWKAALNWAATNDPKSIAAAKAKFEEHEKERLAKKEKANLEKERRKAGLADIRARRQKFELQLAEAGATAEEKAEKLAAFDADPANKVPTKLTEATVVAE
jgi:ParB/RepB/Spo0J family partition protein